MANVINHSLLTDLDIHLFREGRHFRLYEKLGSHPIEVDGQQGTYFAVWAPNAQAVSVIGSFNYWNRDSHSLSARWDGSGIWEGFVPGIGKGELYKYHIHARDGRHLQKGDPFALYWEIPPNTASIVWDIDDYEWKDKTWMKEREKKAGLDQPYSVYEVHMGTWKKTHGGLRSLSYKEMAKEMVAYIKEMGFTHVEFLPVMEHPYFPSWGYQITGYFAPTSRYGNPQEFMYLVDAFHKAGIGVILDWVPSHFPTDAHGLADFDGTHLYDHADPRKGFHPDWKSAIFNYGRHEVKAFLISNALFWLDKYHIDGLRVDAVASMLYLDYSREDGEWIPNEHGGNENTEAIALLKEFNENVYKEFPGAITIAEESTAWTGVSRPTFEGGLGFGQKWMMGWMHDTLNYFKHDPIHRQYHHGEITFSLVYAFSENFMLPLSHDEVVHGKGSIIDRMPGDEWQRFANLRLLYGYMFTHPGTQLLFMGDEFGQTSEWNIEKGLEWWLTEFDFHKGIQEWIKTLNTYYRTTPSLHEQQFSPEGFQWIDHGDNANSTISYLRYDKDKERPLAVICNFTPVPRTAYRIGLPHSGVWKEVLNSDSKPYGGSGDHLNKGAVKATQTTYHGRPYSAEIVLPPLGMVVLEHEGPIRVKEDTKKVATKAPKVSEKAAKSALLGSIGKSSAKEKDDLKKIKGIGPKLEKMLNDLGIYTYQQLSAMTDKEYELVDSMLSTFKGRGKRDDWPARPNSSRSFICLAFNNFNIKLVETAIDHRGNHVHPFRLQRMEEIYEQAKGNADIPHRHDYYTVLLALEAQGEHLIDDHQYPFEGNEVFFVSPGQVHQVALRQKPKGWVLTFTADFLLANRIPESFISNINLFRDFGESPPLELDETTKARLCRTVSEMESCLPLGLSYRERALGALLQLFLIYCNNSCSLGAPQFDEQHPGICRWRSFKKLVNSHYEQWHKVQDYANALYITPKHLSQTVKDITGKTAKTIIQERISLEAKRLLIHTELSIKEIALRLGFEAPLHFSAFFKKQTGQSASDFRSQ